eukprot:TRINITY_DN45301_c0_g1_i1.p1 TRINITY_DN45301_c0_g1~~TRINITY_DN45301_c0_g1_i1.p1  ORF type:complete len:430 (-),score=89.12 TRINITY_DN45301_c0_g1_i1:12-1139(-)
MVAEVRRQLADALPAWDDVGGDIRLLRFLRGFDRDVAATVSAVRDMLSLRARHRLDALRPGVARLPCVQRSCPHYQRVLRYLPGLYSVGLSPAGHVVCYVPIGLHNVRGLLSDVGQETYLEYYRTHIETRSAQLDRLSRSQGKICKVMIVLDLSGIGVSHLTCMEWNTFSKENMDRMNQSLAEGLARMYFVNVPWFVNKIWSFVKGRVPEHTRRKLFFQRGGVEEIADVIGSASLAAIRRFRETGDVADAEVDPSLDENGESLQPGVKADVQETTVGAASSPSEVTAVRRESADEQRRLASVAASPPLPDIVSFKAAKARRAESWSSARYLAAGLAAALMFRLRASVGFRKLALPAALALVLHRLVSRLRTGSLT